MHLHIVEPSAIPGNWEWMRGLLSKAIALDETKTEAEVYRLLMAEKMHAMSLTDGGNGVIVYQVCQKPQGRVLYLCYCAGSLEGGPKERLRKMRCIERYFIEEAKRIGCVEIQGGGRNWHSVLTGWEHDGGTGISLRKTL